MKYIVANWKSNKSREDVEKWIDDWEKQATVNSEQTVVICPPLPSLMFVSNRLLNRKLHGNTFLGVQDISPFPAGRYTGGVSTRNLEGFKVRYAIVGHSERRRYFKETSQDVANKVERCVEAGITPIVCVDSDYITSQAIAIKSEYLEKCMVAYEPVEAIGSGQNADLDDVEKAYTKIKKEFGSVKLIYGGSVTASNVKDYLEVSDGFLVGSASLDVSKFTALINQSHL